ncbi:MAG: GGDEF domain-containing protein [Pseudoxanthomonas sp.]
MPEPQDEPSASGGLSRLLARRRNTSGDGQVLTGQVLPAGSPAGIPTSAAPQDAKAQTAALTRLFSHVHEPLGLLGAFGNGMASLHGELGDMGKRLQSAHAAKDWETYSRALRQLIDKYIRTIDVEDPLAGPTDAEKLRDLLRQTLAGALSSLLHSAPDLAAEAESLGGALRLWRPGNDLMALSQRLRELCHQIGVRSGDSQEQQVLLLGLFDLLLENVGELLDDSSWLQSQIAVVRDLISGPLDQRSIEDARTSLREVIYKQGLLKQGIADSKQAMKQMMMSFVDDLNGMAVTTGEFHERVSGYSLAIRDARSIADLNKLMQDVLQDTGRIQQQALRARDHLIAAREDVEAAERRIQSLEKELNDVAGLVSVDQLTGALNRRGFEELFQREAARTERSSQPICVALLDLDNFRLINEHHGHPGGDAVLRHLVQVSQLMLRATDGIARFGGEEFVILLPDSSLSESLSAMNRLLRALSVRPLVYEDARIFVTFSAGVALRTPSESGETLVKRADKAMYDAKKAGKNRVVSAG